MMTGGGGSFKRGLMVRQGREQSRALLESIKTHYNVEAAFNTEPNHHIKRSGICYRETLQANERQW